MHLAQLVRAPYLVFLPGRVWDRALAATLLTRAELLGLESSLAALDATALLVCLEFAFAIRSPPSLDTSLPRDTHRRITGGNTGMRT